MKFAGVEITQESTIAARQWCADNCHACIDEVLNGDVILPSHTAPLDYFAWQKSQSMKSLAGEYDHTLGFMQKAHYLQTGESVALLP